MSSDDEPIRWRNHYKCSRCGTAWTDEWSCQCDDRCPTCGLSCSPHESEDLDPSLEDADLANSGVVDVSLAQPGRQGAARVSGADRSSSGESPIESGSWSCLEEPEDDSNRFTTPGWVAEHKVTGERRILQHSRFDFHMTPARFHWLVSNDFPSPPGKGPWTDSAIDAAMEDGA